MRPSTSTSLQHDQFKEISQILYDVAGITIADHKIQMVENRIAKRIKQLSIDDFAGYIDYLHSHKKSDEMVHLVNALTTNVTHFFRENHHFEHLSKVIEILLANNQRKIRLWSAGCSIGAEPYSAAITIHETLQKFKTSADIRILATDIDTIALARARKGTYNERIIKGLTKLHLQNYFTKARTDDEDQYTAIPRLRQMISFNHFNFNEKSWPMSGPFDFAFCRNVLIYFDRDKQFEYISKILRVIRPGGFLCLGHSEHAVMERHKVKVIGQTIYQKPLE